MLDAPFQSPAWESMSDTAHFERVIVYGGGAWGTALAQLMAPKGVSVSILMRNAKAALGINTDRENRLYLPGIALHENIVAVTDADAVIGAADALVYAGPAQAARDILQTLFDAYRVTRSSTGEQFPVLLCSKGLERSSGLPLSTVLSEAFPKAAKAVLSGPSFAHDVASGLPTAVTLAASDPGVGARWSRTLSGPSFRLYSTTDILGVELGGAMKNVLAIAAGAAQGAGLGESARAAVIARGFSEFQKLGATLGARTETMAGLSGLGDLILTATSKASRNMSLGFELGQGRSFADIQGDRSTVSEGAATAAAIVELGRANNIDAPLAKAVADLIDGVRDINQIKDDLLARPAKSEA
ncbi:MAG: NAD(P)H-dependent glycerol-3-phosphate dehydrogenase [Pseudomonadota bacterium]